MAEIKEIIQNSKEPEVTKAVFDEIQAIGSDVKKNYSELQSNFDLLKKEVSEKDYDGIVKEKVEKLDFVPEDLQRVAKKSEEMSYKELLLYIRDVEAEGYDATPYRVDLHGKFSLPVACLIICLVGVGIMVRKISGRSFAVNIALGILVIFLYWISHSFCMSLGYGGMLPPVIAAWMSNFIFACLAIFNLLNAE